MFDIGLLWERNGDFARRRDFLPSWSWTGWKVEIKYSTINQYWNPDKRRDDIVWPMVDWRQETVDGQIYNIQNDYHNWTLYRNNSQKVPPPGWERKVFTNGVGELTANLIYHYVHESFTTEDFGFSGSLGFQTGLQCFSFHYQTPLSRLLNAQIHGHHFFMEGSNLPIFDSRLLETAKLITRQMLQSLTRKAGWLEG